MKKIILLIVCTILSALCAKAQDLMTKTDGSTIQVKILSVSDEIVEYKRANYLDGPTFSISVLDLDSITYANGDVQKFEDVEAQAVEDKGVTLGMKYSEYKDLYDPHDYSYDQNDRFSPAVSGVASFFIAGLGQMINEQTLKGVGMLAGELGFFVAGYFVADKVKQEGNKTTIKANGWSIACWCASLAIDIWSICDAVNVAKIKNLYWRDCEHLISNSCEIKILPDLAFIPSGQGLQPTAGLALSIRF